MARKVFIKTGSNRPDLAVLTAIPLDDPHNHPLVMNAEPDWRLYILDNPYHPGLKRAWEVAGKDGSVLGVCLCPCTEYWPKEDHRPWPITKGRPRSMRAGEYFVITSSCKVDQAKMLFTLRRAAMRLLALRAGTELQDDELVSVEDEPLLPEDLAALTLA